MIRNPRSRPWRWLLPAAVALGIAATTADPPLDVHNESLKAHGTADAALVERLRTTFGGENTIVLAFASRAHTDIADDEKNSLRRIAASVRRLPHVRGVGDLAMAAPDVAVLTVDHDGIGLGADVVDAARSECPPNLQTIGGGLPLAETAVANGVAVDRARLLPLIALALFTLTLVAYRRIATAVAVMLPAVTAILVTTGLLRLLARPLDPVSVLLEPVLLTVGVATAVHYVSAFQRQRRLGHGVDRSLLRARADLLGPTLLATLTTMLGFLSLLANPIPAVADFGAFAAFGTAIAHLATLVVLPAFLRDFPGRAAAGPGPGDWTWRTYTHRLLRWRGALVALTVGLGAAGIWSWFALRVDNDPLSVLAADDSYRHEHETLSTLLGGAEAFGVLVGPQSSAQSPERLLPFVASIASRAPVAGLAGAPLRGTDGSALVPLRLQPSGSLARCDLFDEVDDRARHLGFADVHAVGLPVQIARDSERLVRGQLAGMVIAMVGLGLGLWLGMRSWRLAVIGLVPNALPCVLLYGGLAWLDLPLTVANAMIGCALLGLVVDNTIHLLHRTRHARGSAGERIAAALAHVARPMITSSLVLAFGFGLGLFGVMETTHEFALLAAVTIGLAFVGDAVVLPVLLLTRFGRRALA